MATMTSLPDAVRTMLKANHAARGEHGGKKWIQGAVQHPGALRKSLHAKAGKPIPTKALAKAAHSKNPTLAKRARLAQTFRKMRKGT